MKILKIKANGLPLFSETLEIDFFANQNVYQDKNEMLTHIFTNSSIDIYTNNILSIVGINASGKTTALKVISFVIELLQNKPIGSINCNDVLGNISENNDVCIETYFYDDEKLNKLETYISLNTDKKDFKYIISKETLYSKSVKSIRSKKTLFEFDDNNILVLRNQDDIYLSDDVSIIIGLNKKKKDIIESVDCIEWTNFNGLRIIGDFPLELVKFLDPNIELFECISTNNDEKIELRLKFIGQEEIYLTSALELSNYLSSGTIKGINVFIAAMLTLQNGGYLIIDELENHFNIEIVSTLIKFFADNTTNKYGATIIFSTHYTELIDNLERNDCIYIARNIGGIRLDNLKNILERNDVKKSDWFQSGYLEHTTPSYQGYIDFKRKLVDFVKNQEV